MGSRRQMMARKPSLVENCRAGASPATLVFGNRSGCPTAVTMRRGRRLQLGAKMKKKRREQTTQATQSPLRLALCSLPLCRAGVATLLNLVIAHGTSRPRHPKTKEITNSTRNITNRSFAMPADAAAIPPNPKSAATSAMIRNTTAHPNICSSSQTESYLQIGSRASACLFAFRHSERLQRFAPAGNITLSGAALSAARSFLINRVLTRPASRGATR